MKLTRFKLAFLSYALFDLLIGGHCGGLLPLGLSAAAQTTPAYGNITATSSSCLTTNCVSIQLDGATGAATIQLTGTFVATVSFEASNDNGTTWVAINGTPPNSTTAVSSATATGLWQFNVAGFTNLRARGSAYTSGTAAAVINSAHASAKASGGGAVFASGGTTANVIPKSNGSSQLQDSPLLAPDANTVQQANTTNSQTFYVYGTTDSNSSPVNYERLKIFGDSAANHRMVISYEKGGTGASNGMDFNVPTTANNYRFQFASSTSFAVGNAGITTYGGVATVGSGVAAVRAAARSTAQTAAVASVATFTPGADASFIVSANVLVTTATSHSFTVTCAYTDEGNTARTITLPFVLVAGSAITNTIANAGGAVPYMGLPVQIRAKASTAITIATTGTFTTVTYNVEGTIQQVN